MTAEHRPHPTWTHVDGVRTVWIQGPAPLTATLVFGVGRRDEDFAHGGLTHLVEHLVMSTLPRSHLDRNASVSSSRTEFTATGPPEAVGDFLARVCAALADLPLERLAVEAKVLAAEESSRPPSLLGEAMVARYGARGLGLLGLAEPQVQHLSPEQVARHAATAFTKDNAVLWVTGPPPADWRLPLPPGAREVRGPQPVLDLPLPAVQAYESPEDVVVTLVAASSPALLVGLRVAAERAVDRLRHAEGRTYDVDLALELVSAPPGELHAALFADASATEAGDVVAGLVSVLRELADEGPTEEELAHDLDGYAAMLADPRAVPHLLDRAADWALHGVTLAAPYALLEQQRDVTRDDVRDALATAWPSALVLVPEAVADELDPTRTGAVLARGPIGRRTPEPVMSTEAKQVLSALAVVPEFGPGRVEGRVLKPTWRGEMPRMARLRLGEDGVSVEVGPAVLSVAFAELVALGEKDGDHAHLDLVAPDGRSVTVCEQDWRGGAAAVAHVRERAGRAPVFRSPPD